MGRLRHRKVKRVTISEVKVDQNKKQNLEMLELKMLYLLDHPKTGIISGMIFKIYIQLISINN